MTSNHAWFQSCDPKDSKLTEIILKEGIKFLFLVIFEALKNFKKKKRKKDWQGGSYLVICKRKQNNQRNVEFGEGQFLKFKDK